MLSKCESRFTITTQKKDQGLSILRYYAFNKCFAKQNAPNGKGC
jgi:hypothetical protein